jgi:hypothetical protein
MSGIRWDSFEMRSIIQKSHTCRERCRRTIVPSTGCRVTANNNTTREQVTGNFCVLFYYTLLLFFQRHQLMSNDHFQ